MRSRRPSVYFALAAFLLLGLIALPACAPAQQTVTLGNATVPLDGPWKFHIGDNPQWASPDFDDSQWETVDLMPPAGSFDPNQGISGYVPGWTAKGHPDYWGYAWYRIRVRVAAQPGQRLAVAGPSNLDDAYQVFANGALLGSFGKFRGHGKMPVTYVNQPEMFRLPQANGGDTDGPRPATQVLAFRVWMDRKTMLDLGFGAGGFHSAPLLGEANAVAAHTQLARLELARFSAFSAIEAALFFLLAIVVCSLIFFDRSDPVYLWLGAVLLLEAIGNFNAVVVSCMQIESAAAVIWIADLWEPLVLGGWVMVWWVWFRLRSPAWIPKAIFGWALLYGLFNVVTEATVYVVKPHSIDIAIHGAWAIFRLLLLLLLVLVAACGIRRHGREGWLALPAMVLLGISLFAYELQTILHIPVSLFAFGTPISLNLISDLALMATIFALLLRRLLLSVRRQRELALDVIQAREVQRVLIPQELPQVPGLTIESEYRPAREVGGDFFQIIPDSANGSALMVVGDVTGHGLQAGMLVAMIVGAIRTAADATFDPLSVLRTLNQRLCGRGQAHATCLAMHIAADGEVTLANAGHMPPYLNGKEFPMEGALPLGMMEGAEFPVMHFQLAPGDTLMLLSDGVAEAQDAQGHLFGFERIEAMLRQPITAAEVATAAQNFGQEDDISVMRVVREANLAARTEAAPALAAG